MLFLLSPPQAVIEGVAYQLFPTKPAVLLCYLALQGTWVSRSSLALLLRPDATEAVARHQLRLLLNRAKALPWAFRLEIEPRRVRFLVPTDVKDFKDAIGSCDWVTALELYQQALLAEVSLDSPALEEWLMLERNRLAGAWREAMFAQGQSLLEQQNFVSAMRLFEQLWLNDEFDELVLSMYLKVAYLAGKREAALGAFKRFELALKQEFQTAPKVATLALYQQILAAQPLEFQSATERVPLAVLRPPKLIGREHEAAQLRASQANVILIMGEAGVGKSRFALEVLPEARVLRCSQGLEGIGYAPLVSYIQPIMTPKRVSALGVYAENLALLLPELGEVSLRVNNKSRLLEALARLLEQENSPLLFDDLQWADPATLEFITFLNARGRIQIYATVRSNEVSVVLELFFQAWRSEKIVLQPFNLTTIQNLVSSLIGTEHQYPVFSQFLLNRTGGNSFFLLEVIKALFEQGALRVENNDWRSALDEITTDYHELSVPTRVADVILARVSRLAKSTQLILGAASVLGEGLELSVLAALTGFSLPEVLDAFEQLEQANIIRLGRFEHDLLRQSVYANLSDTRRKHWHSLAAKLDLPRLQQAEHYIQAGLVQAALPLLIAEGMEKRKIGLLHEAKQILLRAHNLEPTQMDILAVLSVLYNQLNDMGAAEETAKVVLAQSNSAENRANALSVLASQAYNNGNLELSAKQIEEALVLSEQFERFDANLEEIAFDIFEAQQRYPECIEMLEKARNRLSQYGESGDLAIIISSLAAVYDDTGCETKALPLHFEALRIAKQSKARYAQVNASIQIMWALQNAGRSEEAVIIAEEALALDEFGNSEYLRNGLAASLMHLGRFEEAIIQYEHNAKHGNPTTQALAWGKLAHLYDQLEQLKNRDQAVKQSLENALKTQVPFAQIRACIAVLKYGSQAQLEQILPLVHGKKSPDPNAQAEFEAALKSHGISLA
jgi:DNA-binding SARP family transcriptional activator/tetratricopeptide (TPR) repeat protein